ncbi:SusC/RagA family TonB-linked outer membrane protein [Flavilitoribacter nigricans]|uniref:SusC/RagA family TonB-linked outer membrane protein n=1 Tax=Flavilitoribacter nigricans (strain ATCC 23147 / DSM 23189 / NBRC 102662 / NCIMB 1420 / SS-2) TaxID=1122177 RepID=A0A2D0N7V9_FLAN2|nr:SusC/RagA family TonB-linked outer membrane protein [Flavilitoribacter nigricans]PHN03843.1 SusC/RagA family TonB-linked outer membrane protein [Flavilitoribacter nigricans DSM 23189 = NBRC 102662]
MKLKVDYFSKWLLLVLAITFCNFAIAQRTITGTVTDAETGEPLIGANILVAGTSSGTITDFDGTYNLSVPDGATTLDVSYTGYSSQTIEIGSQSTIDIALSAGELLDEVVVTGYGTSKSREVTGSIVSVKEEDFNKGNVNDPTQLLQGKVAGLAIARPGANPNGGFNIRLRGLSTVGASQQPLVVIDGVLGGDLNSVDPNDIASIDVLKDGSAAAIYGTRGASGVILITTKRGEAGSSKVNYSGQLSLESADRLPDVYQGQEYIDAGGTDLGGNVNWFDELLQTGTTQTHNLSLSGGTPTTSYRVSANYRDVEGVAVNTGFNRINVRGNLTQKALNNRLTISMNLASTSSDQNLGFDEAFRYATIFTPTAPVIRDVNNSSYDQWGGYFQVDAFDYFNPVAIIEQNTREQKVKNISSNIRGDYNITNDLVVGMFYSYQRSNRDFGQYISKYSFWGGGLGSNGNAIRENNENQDQLFRLEARYNKSFANNLDFKMQLGYEFQDFAFQGFRAQGGDFLTDAFTYNNLGASLDFDNGLGNVSSYKNTNRLISYFGRINLNFDDRFFATASLRRDGSSRFGADEKWGLFPAVSLGADLARIGNMSSFDQLKLRAGYGVTGQNVDESLLSLQRFGPGSKFYFNGSYVPSYGPVSNANPNLKWETKTDVNVGLDFAFGDYKWTGSLEYYRTNTSDGIFLFPVPVPPNLFPETKLNVGEIENSGLELTLAYNGSLGAGKSYNITLTGSRWFTPTLVTLSDPETGVGIGGFRTGANLGSPGQNNTPLVRLEEGGPLGQFWGLVVDPNNPVKENGEWNFVDVDGDGTQDDIADRAVIGNGFPKYQLGLNTSFNLNNWDFNIFFRGVFGHDLLNTFRAFYEAPGAISGYNVLRSSADIPTLTDQPQFSSRHVEKADFLRLDNMTIGYTLGALPDGFSQIRIYANAQNLFTLTGYQGVNPEPRFVDDSAFGPLAPGIDRRNTYFSSRTFSFGVNLNF